ncbi:hypothetical protein MmiHf6_13690 [Methanimicrococcus hongohii]|uniref:Uncharacterized protein n=1 Tax=Methanimicrococcus hongohii TaxID=3028295 RepID=A0AA96V0H1_9EURY|nr:hypothetical protein MmiHf6_13690 [Methanimicrococcus sp. Hf6]
MNANAAAASNRLSASTAFTYAGTASEKSPRRWALINSAEVTRYGII